MPFSLDIWKILAGIAIFLLGMNFLEEAVIALPLAAGILYNWGILLSPATGAVLMSLSTVIFAINASLLRVK